jgi:hypothetical protein
LVICLSGARAGPFPGRNQRCARPWGARGPRIASERHTSRPLMSASRHRGWRCMFIDLDASAAKRERPQSGCQGASNRFVAVGAPRPSGMRLPGDPTTKWVRRWPNFQRRRLLKFSRRNRAPCRRSKKRENSPQLRVLARARGSPPHRRLRGSNTCCGCFAASAGLVAAAAADALPKLSRSAASRCASATMVWMLSRLASPPFTASPI